MTGFAVYLRMHSGFFGIQDVGMTGFAGLMPGEVDWTCGDFANGGGTIVSQLPEGTRNDKATDRPEDEKCDDKEGREAKQVARILERIHPASLPEAAREQVVGTVSCDPNHEAVQGCEHAKIVVCE